MYLEWGSSELREVWPVRNALTLSFLGNAKKWHCTPRGWNHDLRLETGLRSPRRLRASCFSGRPRGDSAREARQWSRCAIRTRGSVLAD